MSKIAFVFPGQGSQAIGMGKDLYENSDIAKELYKKADDLTGMPLSRISFEGPAEFLKQTHITQPALFVHSYILLHLLGDRIIPNFAAGHSLGEYTAFTYAGSFTFEDGLKLVHKRGTLMRDIGESHKGTMAALIGLTQEQVNEICDKAKEHQIVQPANFNCPGQIVISGDVEAVHRAMKIAKEEPYNCRLAKELEVSGAFHSELMMPAANELRVALDKTNIESSQIAVFSNVEAEPVNDFNLIQQLLYRQLFSPVQWELLVRNLIREGVSEFYEIGSGKVLTGLIKKIKPDITLHNISSFEDIEKL